MTTKVYLSSGIDAGGFDGSLEAVFREVFALLAECHSAVSPPSGLLYGSMLLQVCMHNMCIHVLCKCVYVYTGRPVVHVQFLVYTC